MAQQYIVFLPASLGVAPSFLQLEIFLSQTCFSIFLFIGKRYEASMQASPPEKCIDCSTLVNLSSRLSLFLCLTVQTLHPVQC